MQALIDGDIVAYSNAASAEKWEKGFLISLEPVEVALMRCDLQMRNILETTKADSYRLFLSGADNFRMTVDPEYKANRKDMVDPVHRAACKEFLVREWKAEVTEGYEADDAMGIAQDKINEVTWEKVGDIPYIKPTTIICTIDKDLNMIPGQHYSWPIVRGGTVVREGKLYEVSEIDGIKSFYRSLLVGDRTDNIVGVAGIGPVKAAKAIDHLETEQEMFEVVRDLYNDDERLLKNGKLLWIMREEHKQWEFPLGNQSSPEVVIE
jgi:5'-3' exonuclease